MNTATAGARSVARHSFPSMGSTIEIALIDANERDPAGAWHLAETLADEWEQTFSRFRKDSELSKLNAAAGQPIHASRRLYDAVDLALAGSKASKGLFDPTVLPALLAVGYDRDFSQIDSAPTLATPPAPVPGINGIVRDPAARTISLPHGVTLDLGGIVKGLYADVLAEMLADWSGGCVSAGGDLRVWGDGPSGHGWLVGVEHPADANIDIAEARVYGGGVATSGTNRRNWRRGNREVHHLIDPRTGQPGGRNVWSVTVVGETASLAEVAATALFLAGGDLEALDGFVGLVGPALVVELDGTVRTFERREH